jgi:hypothetical protein
MQFPFLLLAYPTPAALLFGKARNGKLLSVFPLDLNKIVRTNTVKKG